MAELVQRLYQRSPSSDGPVSGLSKKAKQEHWSIYTLQNGLQSLPNALYQRLLDQATVMTNTPCNKVEFTSDGIVKVCLPHTQDDTTTGKVEKFLLHFIKTQYYWHLS